MSRKAKKIIKNSLEWKILRLLYYETWMDREEMRLALYGAPRVDGGKQKALNIAIALLEYRKLIRPFCEDALDAWGEDAGPFGWCLTKKGQRYFGMKWGGDD